MNILTFMLSYESHFHDVTLAYCLSVWLPKGKTKTFTKFVLKAIIKQVRLICGEDLLSVSTEV